MTQKFTVPGMSCGHCKARIESTLSAIPEISKTLVDLEEKTVDVESSLEAQLIIDAIDKAGYKAKVSS